jgi:predicted dehydrogenase
MRLDIYGDQGSLHWAQADLNTLTIRRRGEPDEVLRPGRNVPYLSDAAMERCWTPAGHPEGFIEAFSNLYADFADAVTAFPDATESVCATVDDGVRGMRFVRAVIASSDSGSQWTSL